MTIIGDFLVDFAIECGGPRILCAKLANPNNGQMLAKRSKRQVDKRERGGRQNYASIALKLHIFPSSNIFMTHPPIAIHKIHIKMCASCKPL